MTDSCPHQFHNIFLTEFNFQILKKSVYFCQGVFLTKFRKLYLLGKNLVF